MINSANIHDDLDVVTSVYMPETSFTIYQPSFDQQIVNPNERILDISTNYSEKRCATKRRRLYGFFNHQAKFLKNAKNLSRFVDYTSITCRFSIPIRLPDVIYVNVIIFNRDNNNSEIATSLKNISPQQILQLIEYNKKFYDEPMLPIYSTRVSSPTTINDLVMVDNKENESANHNIVVLDEKLL